MRILVIAIFLLTVGCGKSGGLIGVPTDSCSPMLGIWSAGSPDQSGYLRANITKGESGNYHVDVVNVGGLASANSTSACEDGRLKAQWGDVVYSSQNNTISYIGNTLTKTQ